MDAATYQTLEKFSGINNVDEPTRLTPAIIEHSYVYPLVQAVNVDIDNSYAIRSRPGYTEKKQGTDIHSLWSNGDKCLYVDGNTLYQMGVGYTVVALRTDLILKHRMSYVPFNDRVYYTNGYQIGYVYNETNYNLVDPSVEFKLPLPPGKLIELFWGCLFVASGNTLYYSDPLCDYYDIRKSYRMFSSPITMIRGVGEGMYLSADRVYFLKGRSGDDFEMDEVYRSPAIPYTDVSVSGKYYREGLEGLVAIWTSENGICVGDSKGTVVNETEKRYCFDSPAGGSAFIRDNNNVRHYINSLY